ncbi:MAG TPA: sodium:proline symporter [Nitrosospira sp.]
MVERSPSPLPVNTMSLNWGAAIAAGVVAGIIATVAQIALWWVFLENALPWYLYRDARLTAAMLMGREVLPPPSTFDWKVMAIATLIHFVLSITYGLILARLISRLGVKVSLAAGVFYGLGIYVVNMYGITLIFPWFSAVRDWITVVTHVVFGLSLAGIYKALSRHGPQRF